MRKTYQVVLNVENINFNETYCEFMERQFGLTPDEDGYLDAGPLWDHIFDRMEGAEILEEGDYGFIVECDSFDMGGLPYDVVFIAEAV